MEDSQIAAALCAELAERIGAERFDLWFGAQTRLCVDERRLTMRATNAFVRDWLKKHFAEDIRACWEAIAGGSLPVEFDIEPALGKPARSSAETNRVRWRLRVDTCAVAEQFAIGTADNAAPDVPEATADSSRPRGAFSLATFVVGPSNEYAFRAAELTAAAGSRRRPCCSVGPTGVGKTHLLRAIVREYRRHHPRAAAVYLSAEQFTTGYRGSHSRQRVAQLPPEVPRRRAAGDRRSAVLRRQAADARGIAVHDRLRCSPTAGSSCWRSDRSLAELRALGAGADVATVRRADLRDRAARVCDAAGILPAA